MKRTVAAIAACAATLAACSGSASGSNSGGGTRTLTVFAASSLTGAFTQVAKGFEEVNPGVNVTFNFGPSDGLAAQIESEGTADVFASASPSWMDDVEKNVGVSDRVDFVQNKLVVITPPQNPAGVASFDDVAKPGVKLVLAAEGVPVGDYARQALRSAGIFNAAMANVVSNEEDDASVVAKVASGEADAGIVYASDVTDSVTSTVEAIAIPDGVNLIATYPIAVVRGASKPDLAKAFVDYVIGPAGQAALQRFGFLPPPAS